MRACQAIAFVLLAVALGPVATRAFAAGQGLSDRIAHCEAAAGAGQRERELTSAIARGVRSPTDGFSLYVARGRARNANCNFTAALADFERALRIKPGSQPTGAAFHIGRADAHLRLQQRDSALADYELALAQNPPLDEQVHIHVMRGFIYSDKGEERSAIAGFTRAIELKPDYADAYWFRAVSHENLNDYPSALSDYDQLARLRPEDWTGWSQVCWGHAFSNLRLEDGLRACDTALRLNPADANTLDGRGFVNFRLGRFAEAIGDYDAALRRNPALPGSLFVRGLAKLRLGHREDGARDLQAAERLEAGIAGRFAGYGITP